METVNTKDGLKFEMKLVKTYPNGKLFFFQERLCITNLNNVEIESIDIIDCVEQIF